MAPARREVGGERWGRPGAGRDDEEGEREREREGERGRPRFAEARRALSGPGGRCPPPAAAAGATHLQPPGEAFALWRGLYDGE